MEYHDQETLEMASYITAQAKAAVMVALNSFWARNGKPTDQLLEMLRERLTVTARQTLVEFFGGSVERQEHVQEQMIGPIRFPDTTGSST